MPASTARDVVARLVKAGATLSVAESCTGGTIGTAITAVPGASEVFKGGVIAYANEAKASVLGVPQDLLDSVGAVSGDVVRAMADGAARLLHTDYAVSVSGIAGPAGGTPDKPVGLVFIGVHSPSATLAFEHHFTGDRDAIRRQAAVVALEQLLGAIE